MESEDSPGESRREVKNIKVTRSADKAKLHLRYNDGYLEVVELSASEAMQVASWLSEVAAECREYEVEELQ